MSSEVVIEVENLSKQYLIGLASRHDTLRDRLSSLFKPSAWNLRREKKTEDFWALKDISFEVNQGDVIGIIGRNGAGKSTLLKILSRITEPTSGRITLRGRVASLLEVGTGFHPELTGRENIFLNGAVLGMRRSEITRKFDEIVAFAEIDKFLDTPVKRYSSGMYVRLAFAVAAHLEPEILIVDEVLAVGDIEFQKKCLGKMQEVSSQNGRTVLFVSHNIAATQAICRRGILLQQGKIVEDADIKTAVATYLDNTSLSSFIIEWPAESEQSAKAVQFRKAAILTPGNQSLSLLTCQSEFKLVVEYEVTEMVRNLIIGFDLRNAEGVLVCGSNSEGILPYHDKGLHRVECYFPGNLFNEGLYFLRFVAHTPQKLIADTDHCLSFQVADTEGHGPAHVKVHGIMRPALEWKMAQTIS